MNVVESTRMEVDYAFKLSRQDLERYLADPQAWAADVRAQLNGAAPVAEGARAKPGPKGAAGAGGRRSSTLKGAVAQKFSRKASGKTGTLLCPECKKPFKTHGRLLNHRQKMHLAGAPSSS